jgi:hypothetical protein
MLLSVLFLCSCAAPKEDSLAKEANEFIGTLSDAEKKKTLYSIDDEERHNWSFLPGKFLKKKKRFGFRIKDMTPEQREKTFDIVKAVTSKVGFDRVMVIMEYETIMRVLEKNPEMRDSDKYFITLFGTPGPGRWALRYEGHHLCLNFTIEDGEIISATPFFFGVNPGRVINNGGTKHPVGFRLLEKQDDLGLKLLQSFSAEQKKAAIVSTGNPKGMRSYEASPIPMKKSGIAVKNLTMEQKAIFRKILHTFTENAENGFATESNLEFETEIEKMYFSWYGNTDDFKKPHSFIIDGPVSYIRFSCWAKDSLKTEANHIHMLWRSRVKDFGYNLPKSK